MKAFPRLGLLAICGKFGWSRGASPREPSNGGLLLAICCKIREVSRPDLTLGGFFSRAVAQLGRAPGSGPGGRGFKSHQPD